MNYMLKVKNADIICYKLRSLVSWWKSDRKILHNFWTTWGISMKFSGKMRLMTILKVTKAQGFTLSLEDTFFEKTQTMVICAFPFLDRKYPFWVNLHQKMKIDSFNGDFIARLIRLGRIPWWYSLFLFSTRNTLLEQIWSKMLKLLV